MSVNRNFTGESLAPGTISGATCGVEANLTNRILFHSLFNVCNGGHIASKGDSGILNMATLEDLRVVMHYQTKAVMVLDRLFQGTLIAKLKSVPPGSPNALKAHIGAKFLSKWSNSADLWMVRTDNSWE